MLLNLRIAIRKNRTLELPLEHEPNIVINILVPQIYEA